jgi:hypothetical protein
VSTSRLLLALAIALPGIGVGARTGGSTDPAAFAGVPASAPVTTTHALPLQKGFYVASDTPCGEASNATLSLLLSEGLNWAREACQFTSIEEAGPRAWRITESCAELGSPERYTQVVEWTSIDDQQFRRVSDAGWVHEARRCPQADLPDPWRDTDLSDL